MKERLQSTAGCLQGEGKVIERCWRAKETKRKRCSLAGRESVLRVCRVFLGSAKIKIFSEEEQKRAISGGKGYRWGSEA